MGAGALFLWGEVKSLRIVHAKERRGGFGGPKSNMDVIEKKPDSLQWCVRGKWKDIKTNWTQGQTFSIQGCSCVWRGRAKKFKSLYP